MTRNSDRKAEAARLHVLEGTVDLLETVNKVNALVDTQMSSESRERNLLRSLSKEMLETRMDPFNDAVLDKMRQVKNTIEERHKKVQDELKELVQHAEEMNERMKQAPAA